MKNLIKKIKIGDIMKSYKRFSPLITANDKIQKALIIIITFIILFMICLINVIPEKYNLNEGDIAPVDIKAARDFVDEVATQNNINKAVMSIPAQYNKDINIQREAVEKVVQYFAMSSEIKGNDITESDKIQKLELSSPIELDNEDYRYTVNLADKDIRALTSFLTDNLSKILLQDIRDNREEDLRKAQEDLSYYIRNSSMNKNMKEIASSIGIRLIKPNLYYDKEKTEQLINQAKKQTEQVVIKKNQKIISKGEVILSDHINLMKKGGLLKKSPSSDLLIYLGVALVIAIFQVIIIMFIYKFKKRIFEDNSKFLLISIIICLTAIFNSTVNIISSYLLASSFLVILMLLIFDTFMGFAVSIPFVLIVGMITNFSFEIIISYVVSCILSTLIMYKSSQRNNVVFSGLFVGLINAIIIFCMSLINNINVIQNLMNSAYLIAGGFISAVLAIGILPAFEQLFNINTPIKLLELSNPNHQLLKKMLFEAPGTYHHSILVGNLAETAAGDIGANSLLARAGSYYHDVGKIKRPYFFKENQITNDNPHDKITPKLSTLIITSHTKDGVELAEKYKLPNDIKRIIEEHHGTTLVRYFYVMAMNDGSEKVEESSFRYEGPKPSSKESGIVMLADSVEAGVRSLSNPTVLDIEKMVEKIVKEKVEDGQLDDSNLTLKDLENIKRSFVKVLKGIFHNRIEYPELNEETQEKGNIDDRV
jgi:cyclic-di-AMP phosphodiesterase PgpH